MSGQELHVAMLPWFAFGHISPFVQLSNKLSLHGIKISFLCPPSTIQRIRSSLHSPHLINIIPLTIPAVDGLPPGTETTDQMTPHMAELLKKTIDAMKPQMAALLSSLRPHFILFDFGVNWLPSVAAPLQIKTLFFSVFSALSTAYATVPVRLSPPSHNPPTVDDLKLPPPGFPASTSTARLSTHEARDLTYIYKRFDGPSVFERVVACMEGCTGIVMKTCMEMEAAYVNFVQTQYRKPVLLAGPVVAGRPVGEIDRRWADWLDKFSEKSVVYCSFGSETFLGGNQIKELLLGLEMAGAPFLVVLNFPPGENSGDVAGHLPEGFEERVKDRGIVHVGWVQQLHILAHVGVGCYVCHAGLSSITEAVVNDCQLVLVPQKGDQFVNARLVAGDLKAGVEVNRDDENGFFRREDLCEAIEMVMKKTAEEPGKTVRENHRKMREFLSDEETHERFTREFVEKMKEIAFGGGGNEDLKKLIS
ncbi:hypothetical protein MRB53_027672 [Persea americana]|uniref:Uncharacterized protein n=1 Tax=Persea americana TaxID=3435 RepID=A0ACC2LLP5_PERAE|nr:hypothetical protein MRB53_027672 [Persea americana]